MDASYASLLVLTVLFTCAAILLVYIVVGTRVEAQVVKSQTAFLVRSLFGDLASLPQASKSLLKTYVDGMGPADTSQDDAAAATANRAVLKRGLLTVGIACLVGVYVARGLSPYTWRADFKEALVAAGLAALTETTFSLVIARNYYCADPNAVRLALLKQLQTA